jgi:hypothetical protein
MVYYIWSHRATICIGTAPYDDAVSIQGIPSHFHALLCHDMVQSNEKQCSEVSGAGDRTSSLSYLPLQAAVVDQEPDDPNVWM